MKFLKNLFSTEKNTTDTIDNSDNSAYTDNIDDIFCVLSLPLL